MRPPGSPRRSVWPSESRVGLGKARGGRRARPRDAPAPPAAPFLSGGGVPFVSGLGS